MEKERKTHLIKSPILRGLLILLIGGCVLYLTTYYRPTADAVWELMSDEEAQIDLLADGTYVFAPVEGSDTGLIFYPGGKVDYQAYAPLLHRIAAKGVTCYLMKMPFRLAVLDINAADGIIEANPQITHWFIGGHSLGGACAAIYASRNAQDFEGLVLLGAYSTKDLSQSGLRVLCMYGENDGVMKRDKYEKDKANLPADFTEIVIPGGCHAYFGDYGSQTGDGTPAITAEEQWNITAEAVAAFALEDGK